MINIILIILVYFSATACAAQERDVIYGDPYSSPEVYGGYDSLYEAIKPLTIIKSNCPNEGRVFVTFHLSKEAEISEVKVANGLCPKEDSIAIEIVRSLKYKPAKYKGEPIETMRSIPIYFTKEE